MTTCAVEREGVAVVVTGNGVVPRALTRLRPLRDFVIVRPLDPPKLGLIDVVRIGAKWARGEVLAVGPGKRDKNGVPRAWGAAVGDVVQFADVMTYPAFDDVTGRVLVIQEADICGIEEDVSMRQVLADAGAA